MEPTQPTDIERLSQEIAGLRDRILLESSDGLDMGRLIVSSQEENRLRLERIENDLRAILDRLDTLDEASTARNRAVRALLQKVMRWGLLIALCLGLVGLYLSIEVSRQAWVREQAIVLGISVTASTIAGLVAWWLKGRSDG